MNEFKERRAVTNENSVQQDALKQSLAEKKERFEELQKEMSSSTSELPIVEKSLRRAESKYNELTKNETECEHKTVQEIETINQSNIIMYFWQQMITNKFNLKLGLGLKFK